jgi:CBS domain-containing protein
MSIEVDQSSQREEGAMTRTVADVMTKKVAVVRGDAPFKEITRIMAEYRVSGLPVVDESGRPVGLVSEGDLLLKEEFASDVETDGLFVSRRHRRERAKAEGVVAADLMSSPVVTIEPTATLGRAARLMHQKNVKRLPVVGADGTILGIVSRADLLKVFLRPDEEIRRDVVQAVSRMTMEPARVRVEAHDGVVTLEGQVERASLVAVLVNQVRDVDGVIGVENLLSSEVDDLMLQPQVITPWGVYAPSLRPGS